MATPKTSQGQTRFSTKNLQSQQKGYSSTSTGSTGGEIGQGLRIETPGLRVAAQPTTSYIQTGAPNAPGSVVLSEPQLTPEPAEITNLQKLANEFQSLNSNLGQFASSFIDYKSEQHKESKKQAEELAIKIATSGGNLLRPIDKQRTYYENIVNSTEGKYTVQEIANAKETSNLLRNIDPRAEYYLKSELQKQSGLKAITGLVPYVQSLTNEDGSAFIVNPHGPNNQLDIKINEYISQSVTEPSVLKEIQPQLLGAISNAKSWMSGQHATQQENKINEGFKIDLDNSVVQLKDRKEDSNAKKGFELTKVFDNAYNNGISPKALQTLKTNFLGSYADAIIAAGNGDEAVILELLDKAKIELASARVGPGEKPPLLTDQLKGDVSVQELDTLVKQKLRNIRTANDNANANVGTDFQQRKNSTAVLNFQDSDLNKEGLQPFTYEGPNGEMITTEISFELAQNYIRNERNEIYTNESDTARRDARLAELDSFESNLNNGRGATLKEEHNNDLQDKIDGGADSTEMYSLIRFYERHKLITPTQANNLKNQVIDDVKAEDVELRNVITEQEKILLARYKQAGEGGALLPTESGADKRFSGNEFTVATNLLRPIRQNAKRIMNDDSLDQQDKINKINQLYSDGNAEFTSRLKAVNKGTNKYAFESANNSYLKENNLRNETKEDTKGLDKAINESKDEDLNLETNGRTDESNNGVSSDGQKPIEKLPPLNLPPGVVPNKELVMEAHRTASRETRLRFEGMKGRLGLGERLTHEFFATHPKFVKEWYRRRVEEIIYEKITGTDPRGRGLTTAQKSLYFKETPSQVLASLAKGNRGDEKQNLELKTQLMTKAVYETPVFVEQINAIENNEKFIPHSGALNTLLRRAQIRPIDYFINAYEIHLGSPMPEELKEKITTSLSTRGKQDGYRGLLYRQPLPSQPGTYGDWINRNEVSFLDNNTLIAGSPSFNINEGSSTRKIRAIRRLGESGSGGEKDAAVEMLKRLGGPQLPSV